MKHTASGMHGMSRIAGVVLAGLMSVAANGVNGAEKAASAESPKKDEIKMMDQWVQEHLTDAKAKPPFSFVYDGKGSETLLAEWPKKVDSKKLDTQRTEHVLTWTDPKTGLGVRCAAIAYQDYPAVEWTVHFTNGGDKDSPILEQVMGVDAAVAPEAVGPVVLHRLNGAPSGVDDWMPFDQPLAAGARIDFAATAGRSSNVSPWFNVDWGNGGIITAIGWSGQWCASVEFKDGQIRTRAGMQNLRTVLHPGESVRSARILQLHWQGGDQFRGYNLFRQTMLAHIMPRIDGRLVVPPIVHLSTSFYELNSSNEKNVLSHLQSIKGLGFEMFWLDAYWTGPNGFPNSMGNYGFPIERVEPKDRFPNGLKVIGDAVEAEGLGFVLWFEPERVPPGTMIAREHPEWVINSLFNLGIPEARHFMTDYLNAAIKAYKVSCLRIDYNIDPLGPWQAMDAKDPSRTGMTEMRYVEGLYQMWDDILRENPKLFIDNCASGGRRIDLETMSRSIPLWRSDNTCDMLDKQAKTVALAAIKNQLMSGGLNRYVPFSTVGQMGATPYLFRSGFNAGIAFSEDVRPKDYPRDLLAQGIAEGKRIRKYFFGNFYPLVESGHDASGWCVLQYHRPGQGDGMVMAFRREQAPDDTRVWELREIDPATTYRVTIHRAYEPEAPLVMKGADLQKFKVVIDERPGSVIVEYCSLSAVAKVDTTAGEAPLPVRFDGAQSASVAGKIVGYEWDFGDGATARSAVETHTYEKAGTYRASLTVKDDQGRIAVDRVILTVAPADVVAPTLLDVKPPVRADRLMLTFSEPVQMTDAENKANYTLDHGLLVKSAVLGMDRTTVTLTTSPLVAEEECMLAVKNIRDCARKPNRIAADTRKTFRYSPLFARWKLDEGKGLVAADAWGRKLDGTIKSGVAWTNAAGRKALSFDGGGGIVEIPTKLEDLAVPFTFTFWVNPAAEQMEYADILGNHAGPVGLVMQQDKNKTNLFGFGYGDGVTWYQAGLVQLAAHAWQHVAVVCDDGKSVCYVNGVEKSSGPGSAVFVPNPNLTFRLGQGYGEKRFFNGLLSDVRIYRMALSPAEVRAVTTE